MSQPTDAQVDALGRAMMAHGELSRVLDEMVPWDSLPEMYRYAPEQDGRWLPAQRALLADLARAVLGAHRHIP